MGMNDLALDYYKAQMSLSWEMNDQETEIRSYENLAMQYYYTGDIAKCKMYHERVMKGQL